MIGRAVILLLLVWPLTAAAGPVDDHLDTLTLDQKVGQLFLVYHSPPWFLAEHGFGGSLVMETMLRDHAALADSLGRAREICAVPPLVAVDQEGGNINRLRPVPGWSAVPSATEMSAWPPDSVTAYVADMAGQLRDLGITVNLAPVLDPSHDAAGQPTWMLHRQRSYGRDPGHIVRQAGAFIDGCAAAGVTCVVKHYPGYDVQADSDLMVAESSADSLTVWNTAAPFRALAHRAGGVMMCSIRYADFSTAPAVFDPRLVARARNGNPDLVVVTDDLWATSLRAWVSGTETVDKVDYPDADLRRLVLTAFDAGNDLLMVTFPAKAVLMKDILTAEIAADPVRRARLDESLRRILMLKAALGLLDP